MAKIEKEVIVELTTTCEPLFKLIRSNVPMVWNDDCQVAFWRIKKHLLNPLVLVPLVFGCPLLMYLAIHDSPTGAYLVSMTERVRRSKQSITWEEIRPLPLLLFYPRESGLCSSVGHAEVAPLYVLPCYIVDFSDRSTKVFVRKPRVIRKTAGWHLLFPEFDITYVMQKYVKGQQFSTT